MSKHDNDDGWGGLTEAARALEGELRRFEELVAAARRMPLNTQKAIERAAKATTGAAAEQERVDLALGALVRAIAAVRERHEVNQAALQARGEQIRERGEQFGALYERFSALGEEGKLLNQLVQGAASRQHEGMTPDETGELAAVIGGIEERMSGFIEGMRAFGQAATAASIVDLAEQADALRQQTTAARNRLGLLRKGLLAGLPDPSRLN